MATDPNAATEQAATEQPADERTSGRDRSTETEPTQSGHSTADDQAERNREDESPG